MPERHQSPMLRPTRRQVIGAATGAAGLIAAGALAPTSAEASSATPSARPRPMDTSRVRRWAADTWRGLVAMTDERTGLVADNSPDSLAAGDRSGWTSPTNIGGMLWSTVAPGSSA